MTLKYFNLFVKARYLDIVINIDLKILIQIIYNLDIKGTVHSFHIRAKSIAKWFPDDRLKVPPKMPVGPVILK